MEYFSKLYEQILLVYKELKKNLHDAGIGSVASEGSSQLAWLVNVVNV